MSARDIELHPDFEPALLSEVHDLAQQHLVAGWMDDLIEELERVIEPTPLDPVVQAMDRVCGLVQRLREEMREVNSRVTRLAELLAGDQ